MDPCYHHISCCSSKADMYRDCWQLECPCSGLLRCKLFNEKRLEEVGLEKPFLKVHGAVTHAHEHTVKLFQHPEQLKNRVDANWLWQLVCIAKGPHELDDDCTKSASQEQSWLNVNHDTTSQTLIPYCHVNQIVSWNYFKYWPLDSISLDEWW